MRKYSLMALCTLPVTHCRDPALEPGFLPGAQAESGLLVAFSIDLARYWGWINLPLHLLRLLKYWGGFKILQNDRCKMKGEVNCHLFAV